MVMVTRRVCRRRSGPANTGSKKVEAIQDMEEQRSGLGVGVWMWESKVVIVEAVLLGRLHVPTM